MSTDTQGVSLALRRTVLLAASLLLLEACASDRNPVAPSAQQQVFATETAFAKTMADRNFSAFVRFVAPDAVFFSDSGVERGITQVADAWRPLFKEKVAPFSWAPDAVEVLASGDLALSTGLVVVNGKIVGRFNSIWRLEGPNTWRIVFDKGERVCAQ